ncbi:NAD(P)-binding protein [Actinomycetospora atypica]|uniref:NAD(P)-binding protein n=1 Tax=Actinomycetospora atypica TaxID=1290095 RepID=A0ABV9YRN5_9PSEU
MLTDPTVLGGRTLPSRVLFGPHVTNLATSRSFGPGDVEHLRARAAGGAGIVVTEIASVTPGDRPHEYAPLAPTCVDGWAAIAAACAPHGTLVLAGLGHAGSQSTSRELLRAPSAVPDPATRTVPRPLSVAEIGGLVGAFATSARAAVDAGCGGVEVNAGQHSLLRQFCSGLTNHRGDAYGEDRALLLVEVLTAVRAAVPEAWVGLRLTVDELAPWAGITLPEALTTVERVADLVDHVVPVRGSAMSVGATRPDGHTAPGFLAAECANVRAAVDGRAAVVLAGSVVDPRQAERALTDGTADLVEMTRAQLADPGLVGKVRAGRAPRPCVLTNQECRARDVRNPRVGCTVEPDVGEPDVGEPDVGEPDVGEPAVAAAVVTSSVSMAAVRTPEVTVLGAGPAGLEAARTLALGGRAVRLVERAAEPGGLLRAIATLPGRERFALLADHLVDEVLRLGVSVQLGALPDDAPGPVLVATGGRDADRAGLPIAAVVQGLALPEGPVVIDDPLGDGAAVALAEHLAPHRPVALVTGDPVAGKLLARTGDLVDANVRLQRAGVERVLEHRVVAVHADHVVAQDVVTGVRRTVAGTLVDAGPRLPGSATGTRLGDALAPRTVADAIREGRRAARELLRAG